MADLKTRNKIVTVRLDPKLWKQMYMEKKDIEMNWEEYLEWLFLTKKKV